MVADGFVRIIETSEQGETMCNAKPGTRCGGSDTQKPIAANAKKLDELKKAWDNEKNPDKHAMLRDLFIEQIYKFKESKVAYYASAKAQKDFPAALQTVKELSGEHRGTFDEVEETFFLAGGQLHELQAKADKMRKSGASQVEVARYFNQGGILIESEKLRNRIASDTDGTPSNGNTVEGAIQKLKALQIATGIMWRDCARVVDKDMKENSRVYVSPTDGPSGSKLTVRKRPTGRFAITSEFIVNADSPAEASMRAQNAFDAENVTISVKPVAGKTSEYHAEANYIYKGGEKLIDELIHQNSVYRGHNTDF